MKNKGFTLVELLTVLIIIGVVSVIIFPSVTGMLSKSKTKSYKIQVDIIEKAAKKWLVANSDQISKKDPYHLNNINITITTLKQEEYLENIYFINPTNNKIMDGCVVVNYDNNSEQYKYKYYEGTNNISKKAKKTEKLSSEVKGCDEKEGYIYTYITNPPNQFVSTNGDRDSKGKIITKKTMFADSIISTNENLKEGTNYYYFSGLNPDNHVKFENNSYIWRILSIDKKEKTIKLIGLSTGLMSSSIIDNNEFTNSTLKTNLINNSDGIDDYLKNTKWNIGTIDSNIDINNSSIELIKSFETSKTYEDKVGILNLSDYLMTIENNKTFITNGITTSIWTMNYENNSKYWYVGASGIGVDSRTNSKYVTPVVEVNANVVLDSGTGSESDPYIIIKM